MNYHYKIEGGAKWLLLFYHNLPKGNYFVNESEALSIDTQYKYSILYKFNSTETNFGLINGKYDFLIEFPNSKYNSVRWTQTANPVLTLETSTELDSLGTKIKKINDTETPFRGLARSTANETFIDGDANGLQHHWYSIGLYYYHNFTIPGPNHHVNEISLWIRVFHVLTDQQTLFIHCIGFIFLGPLISQSF